MTEAQGEGYEHFTYTPYGEAWVEEHLSTEIHRMSHRFTGQELDPETGLYAFPARNYDPRTSRWLSSDPAGPGLMNPNGENGGLRHGFSVIESTNWYNYVSNNPLRYVDPLGLSGGDVVEKSPPLTQVEGLHPAAQALVDKINEVLGREEVQPGFPTDDELAAGALPERGQSPSRATWCNRAACAIADESGANTDSLLNPHRDTGDPSVAWTDANDMYANAVAASNDPTSGVLEVTPEQADALAREGTTVMAIAPGLVDANGNQGRGHAGMVYPSTGPYNPETGPMIGQAGASVGIRSAAESFGRLQPKYFALPSR